MNKLRKAKRYSQQKSTFSKQAACRGIKRSSAELSERDAQIKPAHAATAHKNHIYLLMKIYNIKFVHFINRPTVHLAIDLPSIHVELLHPVSQQV